MIRLALPIAALGAVACTQTTASDGPATTPVPGVECNANAVGSLIGKTESEAVAKEAMRLSGAELVRWLRPDMAVTMEFRAERINLHLGIDGKIGSATCG